MILNLNLEVPRSNIPKLFTKKTKPVYIPADADEAHVHNACWTGEHVARDVHIAPDHAQRPVPWELRQG